MTISKKLNPTTGELDYYRSDDNIEDVVSGKFVKKAGDTMTGDLMLPKMTATTPGYSYFAGGIVIKAGQKLIFDGA